MQRVRDAHSGNTSHRRLDAENLLDLDLDAAKAQLWDSFLHARLGDVSRNRPLLLIDIDGVLNVYGVSSCPDGYAEHLLFPEDDEPTRLAAAHGPWLRELAVEFDLVWASGWGFEAHARLGPILGVDEFPFVPMPAIPFAPRDKIPAVAGYVGDRPVVWIDDLVVPEARDWAAARSAPTLLIETDHTCGLLREHVDEALSWARHH